MAPFPPSAKALFTAKQMCIRDSYIVVMSVLAFLPDFWLWHIGVSEWPLLLAILWWVPSLLLVLGEVGLQMGFFHKLSVRVLFTTILFSAFPKVVFIPVSYTHLDVYKRQV